MISSSSRMPNPKRKTTTLTTTTTTTMKNKDKNKNVTLLYIKRRLILSLIGISWLIIIIRQLISFEQQQQQHDNDFLLLLEKPMKNQQTGKTIIGAGSPILIPPKKRREEFIVHGEYGDYIVIDPTRVKRYIMNRYYYNETTMKKDNHPMMMMSSSSSSSSSSNSNAIITNLDSYLTFDDDIKEERQQICGDGNTTTTATTINDEALLYNKIQVNGPNQGFYQITRTQTTDPNLRKHLLLQQNNVTNTGDNGHGQQDEPASATTTISSSTTNSVNNEHEHEHEHDHDEPIRILCAIYTYHERNDMITAVSQTWGWKCDGFFAASTRNILLNDDDDYDDNNSHSYNSHSHHHHHHHPPPPGYGSIKLPHKGKESYNNMWQKTRSILHYMYTHYLDEYNFFYLCGDDVHVIVENLKATIQSIPDQRAYNQPLFMGNWIPLIKNQQMKSTIKLVPYVDGDYFVCGGPGYVINKLTLKKLVEDILPNCHTNIKSSTEDILVSDCLKRYGIYGNNTVDSLGGQRFDSSPTKLFQFTQGFSSGNTIPDYWMNAIKFWTYHFSTFDNSSNSIQQYHQLQNRISSQVIALHGFKSPIELKQHHAKLYNSCGGGVGKLK